MQCSAVNMYKKACGNELEKNACINVSCGNKALTNNFCSSIITKWRSYTLKDKLTTKTKTTKKWIIENNFEYTGCFTKFGMEHPVELYVIEAYVTLAKRFYWKLPMFSKHFFRPLNLTRAGTRFNWITPASIKIRLVK